VIVGSVPEAAGFERRLCSGPVNVDPCAKKTEMNDDTAGDWIRRERESGSCVMAFE
jgi:hypothetical protein